MDDLNEQQTIEYMLGRFNSREISLGEITTIFSTSNEWAKLFVIPHLTRDYYWTIKLLNDTPNLTIRIVRAYVEFIKLFRHSYDLSPVTNPKLIRLLFMCDVVLETSSRQHISHYIRDGNQNAFDTFMQIVTFDDLNDILTDVIVHAPSDTIRDNMIKSVAWSSDKFDILELTAGEQQIVLNAVKHHCVRSLKSNRMN